MQDFSLDSHRLKLIPCRPKSRPEFQDVGVIVVRVCFVRFEQIAEPLDALQLGNPAGLLLLILIIVVPRPTLSAHGERLILLLPHFI